MKPIDNSKTIEQNTQLKEEFEKERKKWNSSLIELVNMLKDNNKLSEAQVYQLSYRQQIQERIAYYRIIKEQRQGNLEKLITSRFREYTVGYDIKLNGTERMSFVNADCTELKQQVNMINTQIDYFLECVKTLDNFGFAVRNKIEVISQQLI